MYKEKSGKKGLKEELKKILNDLDIDISEEIRKDQAGYTVSPLMICFPKKSEDVQNIVKFCNSNFIKIIVWGAGTSLTGTLSTKPNENYLLLDMTKMNQIFDFDPINWTITVEPGLILEDLNNYLLKRGFIFPPDPASSFMCSIGGVVSEASAGMRMIRYGNTRDWIISMKVVLPNGTLVKMGSKLQKDRAGYNILPLFIGSEGTLGVITEITLRLTPKPFKDMIMYVFFTNYDYMAAKIIQETRRKRVILEYAEYINKDVINFIKITNLKELNFEEGVLILVVSDKFREIVLDIFRRLDIQNYKEIFGKNMDFYYELRKIAPLAMRALGKKLHSEDIVVPIDKLKQSFIKIVKIKEKYGIEIPILSHIGDGTIHSTILYNDKQEKEAQKAFQDICRFAIDIGGTISGEHGIGVLKRELLGEQIISKKGLETLKLMIAVKKLIDPNNIMNPDKFLPELPGTIGK